MVTFVFVGVLATSTLFGPFNIVMGGLVAGVTAAVGSALAITIWKEDQ